MKGISFCIIFFFVLFIKTLYAQVMPQGFLVNPADETVKIGTQVWMKYNLDSEVYQDGTPIERANLIFTNSVTSPGWAYYNYDPSYNPIYGKLYNGYAVNDSRNICPVGFRIPTRTDYNTLNTFLGSNAGGKLKELGTSHWASPNTGATNSSGFTGLPGGYMGDQGGSSFINTWGYFWTSTRNGASNYIRLLKSTDALFVDASFDLQGGVSVRCIKE